MAQPGPPACPYQGRRRVLVDRPTRRGGAQRCWLGTGKKLLTTDAWVEGQKDGKTDGRTDGWTGGKNRCVEGQTDTWMLRWMDEWIGSWTHGWNRVVTGQPSLGAVCGVTRVNGVTATSGPPCRHVPAEVPRPIRTLTASLLYQGHLYSFLP